MQTEEKAVNVHIMHSMKGGCGKSTCALFKTIQKAYEWGIDDEKAQVLFLDADFKGSAMMELLFHRNDIFHADEKPKIRDEKALTLKQIKDANQRIKSGVTKGAGSFHRIAIPEVLEQYITLSEYLRDSSKYAIPDIICHSCSYEMETKEAAGLDEKPDDEIKPEPEQPYFVNGYIDFILSSASSESKDWFRYKEGKIPAGVYSWRMNALIHNILNIGRVNDESPGDYKDIVIDMPPGYDEYSDILLELMRDIAREHKELKLHYYAITTADIGHNVLARDNIKKMIKASTPYKAFSSVNLILSAVSSADFDDLTDKERAVYQGWLETDGISKGNLYECSYSKSFHEYCRKGDVKGFELDINQVFSKKLP